MKEEKTIKIELNLKEADLIFKIRKLKFGKIKEIVVRAGKPIRIKEFERDIILGKKDDKGLTSLLDKE